MSGLYPWVSHSQMDLLGFFLVFIIAFIEVLSDVVVLAFLSYKFVLDNAHFFHVSNSTLMDIIFIIVSLTFSQA